MDLTRKEEMGMPATKKKPESRSQVPFKALCFLVKMWPGEGNITATPGADNLPNRTEPPSLGEW